MVVKLGGHKTQVPLYRFLVAVVNCVTFVRRTAVRMRLLTHSHRVAKVTCEKCLFMHGPAVRRRKSRATLRSQDWSGWFSTAVN